MHPLLPGQLCQNVHQKKLKNRRNLTLNNSFFLKFCVFKILNLFTQVIPKGTVDNNLGPDRLAGPKALDPNYCRQEVLTVHGIELRLFVALNSYYY